MTTLQTIEDTIRQLEYIRVIVETYESIAAVYMRRTKKSIVESRVFYEGLHAIYDEVLEANQKEIADALNKRSFHRHLWHAITKSLPRTREVSVFLSANTGLYGDIIQKTFYSFIQYISSAKTDIVVVGTRGKLLFDERMPRARYRYFDMPDATVDIEHVLALVNHISSYQHIRIFYGKFESFVSQKPTDTVLGESQQTPLVNKNNAQATPATLYLFEPSLKEVARFFETEIFASLFQQIVQESRLAKLAARMYQLDSAIEGIDHTLIANTAERQKLTHQLENKKQLEIVNSRIAIGI